MQCFFPERLTTQYGLHAGRDLQKTSRPTFSSKKGHLWGQMRLFRDLYCKVLKIFKDGDLFGQPGPVLMVKRFLLNSNFSLRLLWVSQGLKWGQPVCRSPDCFSGPFWSWVQHLLSSKQWEPFQISVTLLSTSNSPVSALIKSPTPFTPGPHFPCSASYYQCRGRSSAHWLGYPFPISTPFEFCLSWHRPYMPR